MATPRGDPLSEVGEVIGPLADLPHRVLPQVDRLPREALGAVGKLAIAASPLGLGDLRPQDSPEFARSSSVDAPGPA
jgi:hypothetical protein